MNVIIRVRRGKLTWYVGVLTGRSRYNYINGDGLLVRGPLLEPSEVPPDVLLEAKLEAAK